MPNQPDMTKAKAVFDYEPLMADFNQKLNTQLRSHGADSEYLEMWVPDEDPVKSMLNMAESALAFGCQEMKIRFGTATMDEGQRKTLLATIADIADGRLAQIATGYELTIKARD